MSGRHLSDDRGSMPLAMLLIMVSVSLSALMTPLLLTQLSATRADVRRVHALHAAQAGIDVAMAHIRAAQDAAHEGILNKLPSCNDPADTDPPPIFAGRVGGGTARYEVTAIDYYDKDPAKVTGGRIACTSGYPDATPKYAVITSRGTEPGAGAGGTPTYRTISATYIFNITNANIPGGLIHVYKDATTDDLCLAAESGTPTPKSALKVKYCDKTDPAQIWIYNQFLTITLSATRTQAKQLGMCVDMAAPQTAGNAATIDYCSDVTKPQQQWSINDSANLQGTTDGVNLNGTCLTVKTANKDGSPVVAGGCGGPYNNVHTWSLEATVGAGAAGSITNQIVNFSQFGRCMDITEVNVNKGFLIVWPCKQAPDPNKVLWNQKFTMPSIDPLTDVGEGRVTTFNPAATPKVTYCLKSPGSTAPGRYVTVVVCPANDAAEVKWTFYGHNTSYSTSYILVDYQGNCMAPTDPKVDKYPSGENVSKIVVQPCDGSASQKWNAPPNVELQFPLKDIHEK
ncbi:ricin-type beta-trefoil lectin domain protein [Virgisporangium aurantiacum]|uniref:Ricin B lectin domain-containing protein n=1 Tax=Virgisporangium aurantiacum TaxID=175570 RepID=A0A8J3Z1H0_9ACTN|nr:ricin-type beta-trefoil lectin domain protein [Virgisporangium aurantiacum]GIJ53363.1 hypothetical protein Vau01_008790 [Virgisporangium aurantiacum]